jgi:hypothetical protein
LYNYFLTIKLKKMGTRALTQPLLDEIRRDNGLDSIADMARQTKEYRAQHQGEKHGGIFDKRAILEILSQQGCVALRYYFGIDRTLPDNNNPEFRNPTVIICGVNANGDDMVTGTGIVREKSWACPPDCDTNNSVLFTD